MKDDIYNVLIFNCSRDRRIDIMFPELLKIKGCCKWKKVIFCPADYYRPTTVKIPTPKDILCKVDNVKYSTLNSNNVAALSEYAETLPWQHIMKDVWDVLAKNNGYEESISVVCPSVKDAIEYIHDNAKDLKKADVKVLVTGSLYLVGSELNFFGTQYI